MFPLVGLAILACGSACVAAPAQETPHSSPWHLPREHDPWARFEPRAWKMVRTVTETVDQAGNIAHTSVTTTTTTLADVASNGFRLETAMTVQVSGKRLSAQPRTVQYDLLCQSGAPPTVVQDGGKASVDINGNVVACWVYRLEAATDKGKALTTIYYSADVAPYVLRREVRSTDSSGEITVDECTDEVVHLRLRRRVLGTLMWTSVVKTVHRSSKGSSVTLAYLCDEIPGGVVDRASTEFDSTGRVIRTSALELIGYGCESESIRVFPGLRPKPRRRLRSRR